MSTIEAGVNAARHLAAMVVLVVRTNWFALLVLGLEIGLLGAANTMAHRQLAQAEADSLEQLLVDGSDNVRTFGLHLTDAGYFPVGRDTGFDAILAALAAADIPPEVDDVFGPQLTTADLYRLQVLGIDGREPANPTWLTPRLVDGIDDRIRTRNLPGAPQPPPPPPTPTSPAIGASGPEVTADQTVEAGAADPGPPIPLVVTAATAEQIGVGLGSILEVGIDPNGGLARRFPDDLRFASLVEIVDVVELDDSDDPFWAGDSRLHRPVRNDTSLGVDIFAHALITPGDAATARLTAMSVDAWRPLRPERVTLDNDDQVLAALTELEARTDRTGASSLGVESGLTGGLIAERATRVTAGGLLRLGVINGLGIVVVVTAALLLAAADRSRPLLATVSGRGARRFGPAMLIPVAAVVATTGWWGLRWAVAPVVVAVGLVGWVSTAVVTSRGGARTPGRNRVRMAIGSWWVVAGLVWWLARTRGMAVTGRRLPVEDAAPVVLALAGALVLPWLTLRLGRAMALRSERGRGLARLVGSRRAGRGSMGNATAVVVLGSAMAVAVMFSSLPRSMERAAVANSWIEVGAPARIIDPTPDMVTALIDAVPDHTARRSTNRLVARVDAGSSETGEPLVATLIAVDIEAWRQLTAGTEAAPDLPPALTGGDSDAPEQQQQQERERVPVMVADEVSSRRRSVGDVVVGAGRYDGVEMEVVETRASFEEYDADFFVVDRSALERAMAANPRTDDNEVVDVILTTESAARSGVADLGGDAAATVTYRSDAERYRLDAPLTRLVRRWSLAAAGLTAGLGLLGTLAALALGRRRLRSDLALLHVLGVPAPQRLMTVVAEIVPVVLAGCGGGAVLAVGLVAALGQLLDVGPLVGDRAVPVQVDPMAVVVLVGGAALAVIGLALVAGRTTIAAAARSTAASGADFDGLKGYGT